MFRFKSSPIIIKNTSSHNYIRNISFPFSNIHNPKKKEEIIIKIQNPSNDSFQFFSFSDRERKFSKNNQTQIICLTKSNQCIGTSASKQQFFG